MSRIMLTDFEGDLKTLKRSSKLMRNRDFGSLVQVVDKFHRDVKLSSLTIKDRTQLIHLGEDAQFFRILVRMLHEVTITAGLKQREDLKKVKQWYQKNKEILHGHPHFRGANKELYKKPPSLNFSKDAIRHYALPLDRTQNKKKVVLATEQRSKSAVTHRRKSASKANKEDVMGEEGNEGDGVTNARPLTAPPGLHRPKITNGLTSSDKNMKMVLEENSFMVNYVNGKLSSYDPVMIRPSSAIGVTKDGQQLDLSETDTIISQLTTPTASNESLSQSPFVTREGATPAPPASMMPTPSYNSFHQSPKEGHSQSPGQQESIQPHHDVVTTDVSITNGGEGVQLDERGLPKVIHPLTSLKTPFAHSAADNDVVYEESYHGGQPPDKRSKSPLKLHIQVPVGNNEHMSSMSAEEHKAANLQKWKEFQFRQAFEQELASKQAFFGRGGDPTGTRYTGHDGGEMPEWYTHDVISSYAQDDGMYYQQVRTGDAFTAQALEQFYQDTEKYSPPVRAASRASAREGATPAPPASMMSADEEPVNRGYIPDDVATDIQNRISIEHERDEPSVHFESVVDLAGPVSDAMAINKEMISPEPQLGFRQPSLAITVKPPPTVQIKTHEYQPVSPPPPSQSVYKMAPESGTPMVAPPNSSRLSNSSKSTSEYTQRNRKGEPIIRLPEASEYTVHFKRKQRPVTAAIIPNAASSRQAIKAHNSGPKPKLGKELLDEDKLCKLERTKSAPISHRRRSLRSAGSTSGGRRPRTAIDESIQKRFNLHEDNDMTQRVPQAASHVATTLTSHAVSELMVVNHLMGGDNNNRGARSRMGYRGLKGYDENIQQYWEKQQSKGAMCAPQNLPGYLPDMQFLSITGPAPLQGRGHGDGPTDDLALSIDSKTPSDNASTHPHPDNLPTQQWMGLSISTENQDQLSDPFSRKGEETDSLAGGDASVRSGLSGLEDGEVTNRMRDLEDSESDGGGGRNSAINEEFSDEENDTPRTMDADLDSDLEAAAADMQRDMVEEDGKSVVSRTIDVDMRSVSHMNTDYDEDEEQLSENKISEQESSTVHHDDDDEQTNKSKDASKHPSNDVNNTTDDISEHASSRVYNGNDENEQYNAAMVSLATGSAMPDRKTSEMDILTGTEKADLLSRSFLAVTRNRRVERPTSAHPRLCSGSLGKDLAGTSTITRADSPANGRDAYNGVTFQGWRPGSSESVRSLPVGLTYMPLADEYRRQLEKTVPLLDTHEFPMMPAVSKKPLTPRSSPSVSPRNTPANSIGGSPSESRESFGGSTRSSINSSPVPLVMKINLDNGHHDNDTSESGRDSNYHFQPISNYEEEHGDRRKKTKPTSLVPPHILVRRPSSAPSMRSVQDANISKELPTSQPTSARSASPNLVVITPGSPPSLSPRPNSARRPRSASPRTPSASPRPLSARSPSASPRPSSARELRVSSPTTQRPSSPRGHTAAEWKGRPLPMYGTQDPIVQEEAYRKQKAAKDSVSIQSLFGKSTSKVHKKELNKHEKDRQERKRKEMLEQQRNYNEHMWRRDMALIKRDNMHDKNWEREYMADKLFRDRMRQEKWTDMKQMQAMENKKAQSYLKRIGPTVDIWDMFHAEKRGVTKVQFKRAAITLQKYVRGWIVRSMLKKVIKKSRVHAGSFKTFIKNYNGLLKRIGRWHGIKKPRIHANLWDMDVFMDRKRYYESVFVNRTHPGDEMDINDIDHFFKECDHYPSKREIYNAVLGATKKDPDKPHLMLKEKDVVETAFMIYVPKGTGLKTQNLRKSTWLNPLVDGEEARKLMGSEHVEDTSYLTSIQFVAKALQERKERELEDVLRDAKRTEQAEAKRLAQEKSKGINKIK